MYSQYSSYPQQQTSQQGLVWNGAQWVPSTPSAISGPYASSSNFSTYNSGPSSQQGTTDSSSRVQLYTQYYHAWTAKYQQEQQQVGGLVGTARTEAEGRLQWYKYYADQASRAAHYFYENPQALNAPFELPPSPGGEMQQNVQQQQTQSYSQQQLAVPQSYRVQNQNQQRPAQPAPYSQYQQQPGPSSRVSHQPNKPSQQSQSPDSLKRYVDRCLSQCKHADEKAAVMKQVEAVIQKAVQSGTLHTTNWDTVSVVTLDSARPEPEPFSGGKSASTTPGCNGGREGTQAESVGHYGPAASTPSYSTPSASKSVDISLSKVKLSIKSSKKATKEAVNNTLSYYGPAASNSFQQPSSNKSSSFDSEDFIPVPSTSKRKLEHKGAGFDQSNKVLKNRAQRFAGPGGIADSVASATTVNGYDKYMGKGTIGGSVDELDEQDYENMKVKGTNMVLEKDYLRLTAPPKPEMVRPQPILKQHLANLKAERKRSDRRDYLWFCSQLKAVRQDCTVQHLQNAFAVDVYETHARMALEEGDLNEYNQCQTQLKELYASLKDDPLAVANRSEFVAYRLLYYIFLTGNQKYDGGSSDLFKIMLSLTPEQRADPPIEHALKVRVAVSEVDYHAFFRLYQLSPNLGSLLMDLIVPGLRFNSLVRICRAYRPSVEVEFVLCELGFWGGKDTIESGKEWLESCGCIFEEGSTMLNAKDTVLHESALGDKKSLI